MEHHHTPSTITEAFKCDLNLKFVKVLNALAKLQFWTYSYWVTYIILYGYRLISTKEIETMYFNYGAWMRKKESMYTEYN